MSTSTPLGVSTATIGGLAIPPHLAAQPVLSAGKPAHLDVRAEQAAEYERLFAERELPRWREYKERGAFISARMFRAAFGTDRREDIAKYVIAVEVPSHAEHSEHDADPGFQEFNRLADAYRRIRNTNRFLLGTLADFDPERDRRSYEQMDELDRWALLRLGDLITRVRKAYEDYQFHAVFHAIHNFCAVDLSALYLDIIKDRLYTSAPDDPRPHAPNYGPGFDELAREWLRRFEICPVLTIETDPAAGVENTERPFPRSPNESTRYDHR